MSQVISVQEAASILPELIKRASEGKTVLIGDDGHAEVSLLRFGVILEAHPPGWPQGRFV